MCKCLDFNRDEKMLFFISIAFRDDRLMRNENMISKEHKAFELILHVD